MINVVRSNLNLLVAFQALLEERNVTRAAARIGITQSAMSNALARLRVELGDPLFVRGARGMEPTRRADEIAADLRVGMDAFERVLAPRIAFDPATTTTAFVLQANDFMVLTVVPQLLRRLSQLAPGASIQVLPWSRDRVLPAELEAGRSDVLLLPTSSTRLPSTFRSEHLFDDQFRVLVRQGHPRISHRLTLKKYLAERHVVVTEKLGADGSVDAYLARLGKRREIAVRVPHFGSLPHLVAGGDWIASIDERAARLFTGALPIRSYKLPLQLPTGRFHMIWHGSTDGDPARQFLREQIRLAVKGTG